MTDEPSFRFRSIALPALLPTLLFSIGEGAILPIIPLVATNLGAGLALAGLIAAMVMLGELVGDIPSGWVVARIGERKAMIYAALISVLGLIAAILAPAPWLLAIAMLMVGLSTAVFALARHAFMTSFVPHAYRARALSTLVMKAWRARAKTAVESPTMSIARASSHGAGARIAAMRPSTEMRAA